MRFANLQIIYLFKGNIYIVFILLTKIKRVAK